MGELRVLRLAGVALVVAMLVAACGSDSSSTANGTPTSVTASGSSGGSPDTSTDAASGSDLVPGSGFIQIGDQRHELAVEMCANVFGAINGRAVGESDPGVVKVVFNISPEDWQDGTGGFDEPGSIQYSESLVASWTTGQMRYIDDYQLPAGVDPSTISISSYDIADDGESVTGDATFYDLNALVYETPVAPVTGSFAFACPAG